MRRDHFTTTPEAAARYEANHTAGYDERLDRYEPLPPSREHLDAEMWARLHGLAVEADRLIRRHTSGLRCANGLCRVSLDEETAVFCGHGRAFCGDCVFEEACASCNDEAIA